ARIYLGKKEKKNSRKARKARQGKKFEEFFGGRVRPISSLRRAAVPPRAPLVQELYGPSEWRVDESILPRWILASQGRRPCGVGRRPLREFSSLEQAFLNRICRMAVSS